MFDTYNTRRQEAMVISSMQALQLAKAGAGDANRRESGTQQQQATQGGAAQSLTMTQAETMLKQLVEQGWFEKSRKGYYRLSPRGLMELRGWLVAAYNDEGIRKIKFCAACRDIITAVSSKFYSRGSELWVGASLANDCMFVYRANDAETAIVPDACTTTACGTSFVCKSPRVVLCARVPGRVIGLLVSALSLCLIRLRRGLDARLRMLSRRRLGLVRSSRWRSWMLKMKWMVVRTRLGVIEGPCHGLWDYDNTLGGCLRSMSRGTQDGHDALRMRLVLRGSETESTRSHRTPRHIKIHLRGPPDGEDASLM